MSGAPIIRNRDAKVIGIHFATSKATGVELHEETPPMKGNAIAVSEIVSQLKARKAFIPGLTE